MNRLIRTWPASLLLGVLATGTLAIAQPPGRGPRGGGPPAEMMMKMMPVLDALDADDDGTLSAAEIENATAALKKIDKNGDGKLTQDEMRPDFAASGGPPGLGRPGFGPPEGRRPGGFQAGRGRASQAAADDEDEQGDDDDDEDEDEGDDDDDDDDEQGEARLSADELTQGLRGLVMRADVNRDGFVTGNELIAMLRRGDQGDRRRGEQAAGDRPATGRPDPAQTDQPPRRGGFGGPPRDGDPGEFFAQMFRMRDQNQDGVLKGDEIPEQMSGRLEQIDRDSDGAISRQEMEGMIARMREGGFGPGRGGPGPGRGRPGAGGPGAGRPGAGGPGRGPGAGGEGGRRPGGDLPRRPDAE